MGSLFSQAIVFLSLIGGIQAGLVEEGQEAQEWRAQLSGIPEQRFADLRPLKAEFAFGWADVLQAGSAEFEFARPSPGRYQVVARGGSEGAVSLLWKLEARHEASGSLAHLRSEKVKQVEKYRGKTLTTRLELDGEKIRRLKESTRDPKDHAKWKTYDDPEIRDLVGVMLLIRSQPLKPGDTVRAVAYPSANPFLVTVQVAAHEKIEIQGSERDAIRLELDLKEISTRDENEGELVDFEKFKGGRIWLSNDKDRLPLRAEIDTFIGYVYGELTDVEWGDEK